MKIEFTTSGAAFCDPCTGEESPLYKRIEVLNILNGEVKRNENLLYRI